MEKISINTLLNTKKYQVNISNSGAIDIKSLMSLANNNQDETRNFSPELIINKRKERREKILESYNKEYGQCIDKIKMLNEQGKLDLIYEVPRFSVTCSDYISSQCIDFIVTKLSLNYMDAFKINDTSVFVTWKYIELNKEKAERKMRTT